jgi:hypothetical protein
MNTKITEIKARARDFYLDQEDLDCTTAELHNLVQEKFAELLITECFNLANQYINDCGEVASLPEYVFEESFGVKL